MTRPAFRDWLRRQLQLTPPIDVSPGGAGGYAAGMQPDWSPSPTNFQINDCIQQALSRINAYCGCHITQITLNVSAQTSSIPFGVYLGDLTYPGQATPGVSPIGLINDLQRVLWTDTGGSAILLQATSRAGLDRFQGIYYSAPPSEPSQYYVEGYTLYLTPAPVNAGTLTLTCGTGFVGLQGETDVVDQLPVDFQYYIGYEALALLSLQETMDAEARERAANFLPLANEGKALIKAWKEGQSGTTQPSLTFQTYRFNYGCQRVRR